ncbi:enoyl-CoA hydratase/isomerase family protein [Chloroflexota bacterium]
MSVDYVKEGKIAIITINRPRAFNAVDLETWQGIQEAMYDFRDDPDVWVGIVTGAGEKAFCAGADVGETLSFMKENRSSKWSWPATPALGLELWKPLVAAINGYAFGGGLEIALACDIRIASENARLGTPEVTLGLIPGWGGTQRLPRMIPWCKAAELVLMGKQIDAQEAYRIGLVNKVVPHEELMSTAREWAETICQAGPMGVRAAKEAMIRGASMTLEDGLRLENALLADVFSTEDFKEGTSAFLEKRKPDFKAK